MSELIEMQKKEAVDWFRTLRDEIRLSFEKIEEELTGTNAEMAPGKFDVSTWERPGGGGGEMSVMKGRVFEKVGVNISAVHGEFSEEFKKNIPGTDESGEFWAAGISLVAHMRSPHVPAVHMNTRHIVTKKSWFGGGADLTPMFPNDSDKEEFHSALKTACDKHDKTYYPRFKKWCDEYFYLPSQRRVSRCWRYFLR